MTEFELKIVDGDIADIISSINKVKRLIYDDNNISEAKDKLKQMRKQISFLLEDLN